jgi:hypothetical protein
MTIQYRTIFCAAILACVLATPQARAAGPYTFEGERAAHPNLAHAIDQMYAALADLRAAPDTFGGHKGQAVIDLEHAILSTKRALYFRMHVDDRALEGIR